MAETVHGQRRNLGERLAFDQRGGELLGDRDRDVDRFGLELGFHRREAAHDAFERGGDALQRHRGALLGFGHNLCPGGRVAALVAGGIRVQQAGLVQRERDRRLDLGGRREVLIEQEFGG